MSERRPFHETIVDAIENIGGMGPMPETQIICLAALIKATKIPKNHVAIGLAWKQACDMFGVDDYRGVLADLLEQKQEAKAEDQKHIVRDEDRDSLQDVLGGSGPPRLEGMD